MGSTTVFGVVYRILVGFSCLDPVSNGFFCLEITHGMLFDTCFSELGKKADAFTEAVSLGLGLFWFAHYCG